MRGAWPIVLALLAAGCAGLDPPTAQTPSAPTGPAATRGVLEAVEDWRPEVEPPEERALLAASVALSETWVKPRRLVAATVDASEGANVSRFLGAPGGDPFATFTAGAWYLGGGANALPQAGHHRPPRHHVVEGSSVPPGDSTRPFELTAGRYVVAEAGGARFEAIVRHGAPAVPVAHVVLVEDAHGRRFSPDVAELSPETRVRIWNGAEATMDVAESSYHAPLSSGVEALDVVGVDPGAYDVIAIVRDASSGRGEASTRLLVDFESPPPGFAFGAWSGRVSEVPAPTAPRSATYLVAASFPVERIEVEIDLSPVHDALVRVALRLAGEAHVETTLRASGTIVAEDLPRGDWEIVVEADRGVASYTLWGTVRYRVEAPE